MADIIAVVIVMGVFLWVGWIDRNNDAPKREAEKYFADMEKKVEHK